MRGRKLLIYITGFFLATLFTQGDCRAEFSLHPGIYTRLEVTDNLFLSNTNGNRELIATFAPNFWLEQTGKLLNMEMDYTYEMYRFLNEPSLNGRANAHFGTLDGTFMPDRSFNIALHGDARLQNLDTRSSDIIDTPIVNVTNRYSGWIRPNYRLDFGSRHSAEMAYVYEIVLYDEIASDDTNSHKVELAIERRQSARIDLMVSGFYEQLSAKINPDFERLQGLVGGEWRPFTSTTLSATGGVAWFDYATGENFRSGILDCWLRYAPSRRWSIDASYIEDFAYDVRNGLYKTWLGEGALAYSGRLSLRLSLFFRNDDYVLVSREDSEKGFVGDATYQLTQRIVLGVYGDIRTLKFEPLNEKVERYSIGASLEYTPRDFITMGCRYSYRNSDSSINIRDYFENRADCDLRLTYPLIP